MEDLKKSVAAKDASSASFMPKPKTPMQCSFTDVSCYVPAQLQVPGLVSTVKNLAKRCAPKAAAPVQERQILHSITGVVNPGEVVAIMGPSGSGKTTLLSLLAGRNKARHTGEILYNDEHKPTDKAFRRQLGYVSQEDLLFEGLTVFETLYYTAVLRLPKAMTDKDKRERVESILKVLGISHCKGTIVGGFRIGRRGISGGEKKRVAIGQELLYNPSVVLLDEPTSGLDSTTALNLVHTLRTLAQVGNRTIVTTIHQPSSRIYQMLDKLLLLGLGHLLYFGDASDAADYFATIGYTMPYGMNPADYFLDVASGWSGETKDCEKVDFDDPKLETLLGAIEKKPYTRRVSRDYLNASIRSEASPKEVFGHKWHSMKDAEGEQKKLEGPSYFTQMKVICVRSIKERRFERFSTDSLFTVFFMAVLCGILWWQAGRGASLDTYVGATDVAGLLFFLVTFQSFNILFSSIFTFPNEKTMLLKEREAGMYPISAFFFGRTVADIPLDTLIPVTVTTIIYVMSGLKPTVGAYLLTMMVVLLTCFTAGSLGLLIGAAFLNLKRAQSVATVMMLTIMLTGGFFVREIPIWLSWISYLSYINYAWDALINIHLRGRVPECNAGDEDCEGLLAQVKYKNIGVQFGILCLMLTVLRFGVYIALRFGAKSR